MAVIDYNQIAASVYQTVLNMNSVATSLIGMDAMWCRLLPYENGEDVIVLEYTLHSYECPKLIKVVTSKTDYLVGNFSIDLWGMHQEVPLEINIDLETWKSVYGSGTMPQKGDFVLIPLLHKPFEVKSSVVVYTVGELPTSYKCVLGQWQHNANRRETEEFTVSIDNLTESQDRLFGEVISKEVADAVVEVETAYNSTTWVDPIKEFDMDCITISDALVGESGNVFSNAYYNFNKASKGVLYNVDATYDPTVKENHWIYSCWFNIKELNVNSGDLKIKKLYLKEKDFWSFEIQSGIQIEIGEGVTIYRGNVLKLNGIIEPKGCEAGYVIKIAASDCLKASAKVSNWWSSGSWKIRKAGKYNLLSCYNGGDEPLKIDIDSNNLTFKVNGEIKKIALKSTILELDTWMYFVCDLCPNSIRSVIVRNAYEAINKYVAKTVLDTKTPINIKTFSFDSVALENKGSDICMTNIRLYENEYPLEDTYKLDMYSMVTRNAGKLILVDVPNAANDMSFQSKVR